MPRRWSVALAAVSLALVVNALLHLRWFGASAGTPHVLVDLVTLWGPAAVVAYGAWLLDALPSSLAGRVVAWTLSGTVVGSVLATLALYGGAGTVRPAELGHALQLVAPAGTAVGLAVGHREVRFVESARDAERARARAASLARERRTLERLNSVLRHHVLNGANVIAGNAELVRDHVAGNGSAPADGTVERLDAVQDRATELATTVDRVRTLINATAEGTDPHRLDGVEVLERELEWAREHHPDATLESDLPETAPVEADELLSEAFHELLANALEHAGEEPTVAVAVERNGDSVAVRVADDGDGLPGDDAVFDFDERGDGGLGLYLVESVLERYGEVTVEDGEAGTTVRVELRAA